jgi:hypothetical protein
LLGKFSEPAASQGVIAVLAGRLVATLSLDLALPRVASLSLEEQLLSGTPAQLAFRFPNN